MSNLVNKQKESMSLGRQEAFEIFKRDYVDSKTIEKNKQHWGERARERSVVVCSA